MRQEAPLKGCIGVTHFSLEEHLQPARGAWARINNVKELLYLQRDDAASAVESLFHRGILHDPGLQDGQPRRPLRCICARSSCNRGLRCDRRLRLRLAIGIAGPRAGGTHGGPIPVGAASVLAGLPWTLPLDWVLARATATHSNFEFETFKTYMVCPAGSCRVLHLGYLHEHMSWRMLNSALLGCGKLPVLGGKPHAKSSAELIEKGCTDLLVRTVRILGLQVLGFMMAGFTIAAE